MRISWRAFPSRTVANDAFGVARAAGKDGRGLSHLERSARAAESSTDSVCGSADVSQRRVPLRREQRMSRPCADAHCTALAARWSMLPDLLRGTPGTQTRGRRQDAESPGVWARPGAWVAAQRALRAVRHSSRHWKLTEVPLATAKPRWKPRWNLRYAGRGLGIPRSPKI